MMFMIIEMIISINFLMELFVKICLKIKKKNLKLA